MFPAGSIFLLEFFLSYTEGRQLSLRSLLGTRFSLLSFLYLSWLLSFLSYWLSCLLGWYFSISIERYELFLLIELFLLLLLCTELSLSLETFLSTIYFLSTRYGILGFLCSCPYFFLSIKFLTLYSIYRHLLLISYMHTFTFSLLNEF